MTSIIQFKGSWEERSLYGLPMLAQPVRVNGRLPISIIHHELAHLASARTTRLGLALGAEAARLLWEHRRGEPLAASERARAIMAGFLPVLEGLAIYAELDADEVSGDLLLSHPISQHSQMLWQHWPAPERHIYFYAMAERIFEPEPQFVEQYGEDNHGLLQILFGDHSSPASAHYLVGYLWVKSAVAVIARHAPRLARFPVALPLLTRLFCDHPIIEAVWRGDVDHTAIPTALLETVNGLDEVTLMRLEQALDINDVQKNFDHIDFHTFLTDVTETSLKTHGDDEIDVFLSEDDIAQYGSIFSSLRAAASMHFIGSACGVLESAKCDSNGIALVIRNKAEEAISWTAPNLSKMWARFFAGLHHQESAMALADEIQRHCFNKLQERVGQHVELANFWLISDRGVFGTAVWDPDGKWFQIPITPDAIDPEMIPYVKASLAISLQERRDFADNLGHDYRDNVLEDEVMEIYLKNLISDPFLCGRLIDRRFIGVLSGDERRDVRRWVVYPMDAPRTWELAPATLTALSEVFDMPGFLSLRGEEPAKYLLPELNMK